MVGRALPAALRAEEARAEREARRQVAEGAEAARRQLDAARAELHEAEVTRRAEVEERGRTEAELARRARELAAREHAAQRDEVAPDAVERRRQRHAEQQQVRAVVRLVARRRQHRVERGGGMDKDEFRSHVDLIMRANSRMGLKEFWALLQQQASAVLAEGKVSMHACRSMHAYVTWRGSGSSRHHHRSLPVNVGQ